MKHLRKFDSVSEMNTVLANSNIAIVGLAFDGSTPVLKKKNGGSPVPPTPSHDYVEIGGVKWATMNVGANSPTDLGLFFRWGETQGYTLTQLDEQTYPDYKYMDGEYNYTKYNYTDEKTVLDLSDDAVNAAWGGNWRMPTQTEIESLCDFVDTERTTNYQGSGANGWLMTDKTDSSKILFFPDIPSVVPLSQLYWSNNLLYVDYSAFGAICYENGFYFTEYDWSYGRTYFNVVRGVLDD